MKQLTIQYMNRNIVIYESGNGDIPVILLHGAGLDSALLSWREVMALMPEQYKIYAIDLIGHGLSDGLDNMGGPHFYDTHIDCLSHIVNHLNLNQFVLSGLSMGGAIAIGYALKNPNKVKALIPVNTWGITFKMPLHSIYYWYVNTSLNRKMLAYTLKHRWLMKVSIRYSLISDKTKVTDTLVDDIINTANIRFAGIMMEQFQRSSITKQNTAPYYWEQLAQLTMPLLFINGEKDPLVKCEHIEHASRQVTNSRIHIMKQCKHWTQKERPEEFVDVLDSFISSLS